MKCVNCGKGGANYKISFKSLGINEKGKRISIMKHFHFNCLAYYPQFIDNIQEQKKAKGLI